MWRLIIDPQGAESAIASALLGYLGGPAEIDRRGGMETTPRLEGDATAVHGLERMVARARELEGGPPFGGPDALGWFLEPFFVDWVGPSVAAMRTGEGLLGRVLDVTARRGRFGDEFDNRAARVGSAGRTLRAIERAYANQSGYLGGRRPALLDFFVYGALAASESSGDAGGDSEVAPEVRRRLDWIGAMELPHPVVALRGGSAVEAAQLRSIVGEFFGTYWRVLCANLRAIEEGRPEASVELVDGRRFSLQPRESRVDRLGEVLDALERIVAERPELLGERGVGMAGALEGEIDELRGLPRGSKLVADRSALDRRFSG